MDQSLEYYKSLLSETDTGETPPIQQNQNNTSLVSNDDDLNSLLESEGEDANLFTKTTSGGTNVKEDHEVKAEVEKDVPPSQDDLYTRYQEKYPELFENGKLVDFDAAQNIGIVTAVSGVPGDDETVTSGHISTKTDDAPFGFFYNTETESTNIQKTKSREAEDYSRVKNLLDEEDPYEGLTEAEELKDLNDTIEALPEKNQDGSVNLMKKFLEITGPTGLRLILGIGRTADYTGAGFQDAIEKIAKEAQDAMPDVYNTITSSANKARGMAYKPIDPKTLAKEVGKGTMAFLEFSEIIPVLGQTQKLFYSLPKANQAIANKLAIRAEKNKKKAEKAWNRTLNVSKMKAATAEELFNKKAEARKVAEKNKDIANELIDAFEKNAGAVISKTDSKGNKTLDYKLAREVGNKRAIELVKGKKDRKDMTLVEKIKVEATGATKVDESSVLFGQGDTLFEPILKPEKFDGIVAIASDFKKMFPNAFNNNKPIIDNLLDLTVKKDLIATDKLYTMLNKYDISFEEYVLTVAGSGSKAGKVLAELSKIKRARPVNEKVAMQQKATIEAQGAIRDVIQRVENIRRGGLVSQIATAARNLTSSTIRAPLESLGNVVDSTLYQIGKGNYLEAVKGISPLRVKMPDVAKIGDKSFFDAVGDASPIGFSNNWKDSFANMKYMFDNPKETKEVVDFILERPELAGQFDLLFNNINEIMIATGRGKGGILDKLLTEGEDAVMALNIPNRWQEFLVRRGAFLGELERLTKREYGIDLFDTLREGKIRDLLNDAGNVKPADARSFIDLVTDSTQKALNLTYAKQPDVPMFRSISSFIVRNGLTVALPFPRFMFNSMELMGQYMGGASLPLGRKLVSILKPSMRGALTAKEREQVSRNLIGVATMYGAYQYRNSEEAPPDYKKLKVSDGTEMDTTPQFPVRQFLYLGESAKRFFDGTLATFFDSKEFLETFLGTNVRVGVGQSIFQDIANIIDSVDITDKEKAGKALIGPFGDYLASWFVPFNQITDTQRALGFRGTEYKDFREDPVFEEFLASGEKAFKKPFKQRALGVSPEEEEKAPKKEFVFTEKKERVLPMYKVLLGLNLTNEDSEAGKYLMRYGYTDFKFGSKSGVPSVQRAENRLIRDYIPEVVRVAELVIEKEALKEYRKASKTTKDKFTERKFVVTAVRNFVDTRMRKFKNKIASDGLGKKQSTEYARQLIAFRRFPKSLRDEAIRQYYVQTKKAPELDKEEPLATLVKIGKKLREKM
jgi:hypothetical protein